MNPNGIQAHYNKHTILHWVTDSECAFTSRKKLTIIAKAL